ncbi:MAG: electron transport complex subunit E [Clostridiales bacterium]|jgi:electron transport complex protein RnfE|nr:electron transport complex subunit E [Clostridia bacterium]NLH59525.1 electron transport complex subunit E [Clostridiales bacterium]
MKAKDILSNGIIRENPIFRLVLGMCPTLAVTTAAINGLGMGVAVIFVLSLSNLAISLLKDYIPEKVRIPAYVVVIASFVTIVDMLMHAFTPALYDALGLYIPLIVVNCIILARAESFASKNKPFHSFMDGIGMGIGFTLALTLLGMIRELLGLGSIFGIKLLGEGSILSLSLFTSFKPAIIMILPPGAFFTLGLVLALINKITEKKESKQA